MVAVGRTFTSAYFAAAIILCQGDETMYEMKPEYYTGIQTIDQEHTRLFELAEETHQLLHDDFLRDDIAGRGRFHGMLCSVEY